MSHSGPSVVRPFPEKVGIEAVLRLETALFAIYRYSSSYISRFCGH